MTAEPVARAARDEALALLRLGPEPPAGDRGLQDRLADPRVQDALHRFALDHGVLGAVLLAIQRRLGPEASRQPAHRRMLAPLPVLRRQAALWDLERDRLLARLQQRGLAPVVLKGAALRALVYPDSVERGLGDLDLLFPRDAIGEAMAVLESAGYDRGDADIARRYWEHHFHYRLNHPGGFQVEVHWDLMPPDGFLHLAPDRLLRHARALRRPGAVTMRVPSAEDLLLHLASQQVEDSATTLRRLVDADRVIRHPAAVNWEDLRAGAREGGLGTALALSLQLAECLLHTPLPVGFISRLGLSRPTRYHLALWDPVESLLTQSPRHRAVACRYLDLWLTAGAGPRLQLFREMVSGRYQSRIGVLGLTGRGWARWRGLMASLKLLAYWGWLYLRRAGQVLAGGKRVGRFWGE